MGKNTSISLSPYYEDFIKEQVNSGKYGSASEVLREALRLLKNQKEEETFLLKAIEEGEASGFVNYDAEAHLDELINS